MYRALGFRVFGLGFTRFWGFGVLGRVGLKGLIGFMV